MKIVEKNRLRLIALSTDDSVIKQFALNVLNESSDQARKELSETCWLEDIDNLRGALIHHNQTSRPKQVVKA